MKPWYQSKTVWIGILTVIISLLNYLGQQDFSDLGAVNWPTFAAGALMIVLRWVTDQPITSVVKIGFVEKLRGRSNDG